MKKLERVETTIEDVCLERMFKYNKDKEGILLSLQEWEEMPIELKESDLNGARYLLDYVIIIQEECDPYTLQDIKRRIYLSNKIKNTLSSELLKERVRIELELKYLNETISYLESVEAIL